MSFDLPTWTLDTPIEENEIETRRLEPTPIIEPIEPIERPVIRNSIKFKRPNNERLVPTDDTLADKNFSISLWIYFQVISKSNLVDGFRYVKKDRTTLPWLRSTSRTLKKCSEHGFSLQPVSINTASKQFKYLKEQGYVLGECEGSTVLEGYKGQYYRINNTDVFKYYTLMEVEFLEYLNSKLSNEALKIYLLYYSFNTKHEERECYLHQEEILKRVGFSKGGKNYDKLRFINKQLMDLGLITIDKKYEYNNGVKIKEKNTTTAPLYWKTTLYSKLKRGELEP